MLEGPEGNDRPQIAYFHVEARSQVETGRREGDRGEFFLKQDLSTSHWEKTGLVRRPPASEIIASYRSHLEPVLVKHESKFRGVTEP